MGIFAASGICKTYWHQGRRFSVLEEVGLELEPGTVTCVLGPSGAGKSTLLRILAGLEAPDRGRILLGGDPVCAGHPGLAIMFQDPCLLPWLTVRENIAFGIRFSGRRKGETAGTVDDAVRLVGLEEFSAWRPARLSGGMAQRVNLARALVRSPRVLLLDEPLSALDVTTRRQLQDDLRRIVTMREMGAIFITHDVEESLYLADQLLVLSARPGRVMMEQRVTLPFPRDLRHVTADRLRSDLFGALNALPAARHAPYQLV